MYVVLDQIATPLIYSALSNMDRPVRATRILVRSVVMLKSRSVSSSVYVRCTWAIPLDPQTEIGPLVTQRSATG